MPTNVLIVEDERIASLLLQKYIKDNGYFLSGAVSSGEDAIEHCQNNDIQIVLMDITLEGKIDGISAASIIFEKFDIPFIFITTASDDSTIERSKETNPYGYIIKPVDRKELRAAIEMALMRHKMENALKENELRLSTILNSIGDAVIVIDTDEKLTYINPIAEKMLEYSNEEIVNKKIGSIVKVKDINGVTIETLLNENIHSDNRIELISSSNKAIPVSTNLSPLNDFTGTLKGSVLVLRDISKQLESEMKLQESFQQLRTSMGGVIQAMAHTVETRDPYTSGHQKRVTDIARHIAQKLELSEEEIEGIRMAGVIHDLGKISIPAEILSKPGKITAIEYNIIKNHPETGYNILKNIEFPWPVAEIVYQHHEKLDGSGYPRGLKDGEICIEARVIAVADVVEAMSSHRPYRASLGIEVALEEIKTNSDILYDKDVVDACIKIFKEDNFTF